MPHSPYSNGRNSSAAVVAQLSRTALHLISIVPLALGTALVLDLLFVTLQPRAQDTMGRIIHGGFPVIDAGTPVALALLIVTPVVVGLALRRVPLRTARGVVMVILVIGTLLVGDLVLCSQYPSVFDGFVTLTAGAFWGTFGLSLLMILLTALAMGVVSWRLELTSFHSWVIAALTVGTILVGDLVLVACVPPLLQSVIAAQASARWMANSSDWLLLAVLVVFVPVVVTSLLWILHRRSWWWVGGGYLALAPVLVFLAKDDPTIRRPIAMEEIAPAFPGAEASFNVLMRYGNKHPLGRGFRSPSRIWSRPSGPDEAPLNPAKPEQWQRWLLNHRSAIAADWADLAPVRAWWADLNAFDRIGDLTPTQIDIELPAFGPLRAGCQFGCAIASLEALDGHGDDAIETLLPVIQVGRKLQPSARTLVRQMVGIVIERMTIDTATFILDRATVSPATRSRLIAALAAPGGGPAGARRLIAVEYAFSLGAFLERPLGDLIGGSNGWVKGSINVISPFVYNRRAAFNLRGELVADLQELIAAREFGRFDARERTFAQDDTRAHFKNYIGSLLMRSTEPAYVKVAESYWKAQDMRAALLARLNDA